MLASFGPESIVTAGLTADYTAECLDFIRKFENDPDPALSLQKKAAFQHRMRKLFLQGCVALEPDVACDPAEMTMLQSVMKQVEDQPIIYCNGRRVMLWSSGASAKVQETMARMHTVVYAMLERLDADLSEHDMATAFEVMDIASWADIAALRRKTLGRKVQMLMQALRFDPGLGSHEFDHAIPILLQMRQERLESGGVTPAKIDNRTLWGNALEHIEIRRCSNLCGLIRVYLALELGTCQLERNLGRLTHVLDTHTGPIVDSTTWFLVEGMLDGPEDEGQLFKRIQQNDDVVLELTDFSRECQRLWIHLRGRRFSVNRAERSDLGRKRKRQTGTDGAVLRGRRLAASRLVSSISDVGVTAGDEVCVTGLQRKELCALSGDRYGPRSKFWTAGLDNFRKHTARVKEAKRAEWAARKQGVEWCAKPKSNVAHAATGTQNMAPRRASEPHERTTRTITVAVFGATQESLASQTSVAGVTVLPGTLRNVSVADVLLVEDGRWLSA